MTPGFFFRETMRGMCWRIDTPTDELAIDMHATLRAPDVRRFVRDRLFRLEGEISIEGFATNSAVDGTVEFRLLDERRLPYRARFHGDDGKRYELRGQKEWTPVSPVDSMTTLPASIYDEAGNEVARATLRFDARNDTGRLVRSLRVSLHG